MKNLTILITLISAFLMGCEKQEIGYLHADVAEYRPDSLVIKAILNPDDPEDLDRITKEQPWQSEEIEGIQGTAQIHYTINAVHPDNGYNDALSQFTVVGKGKIQIEYNHTLPIGDYTIDLKIWNEGHSVIKYAIFKIIVE